MKVVITGPESTGKSTLCKALAEHFDTSYVPEYARTYLQNLKGKYTQADLTCIAAGQIKSEDDYQEKVKSLLICDTSLEVIRVWSEWKYKSCDKFILDNVIARTPDLFLLCVPDIPWQPAPQRENPHDREALFDYYQASLKEYNSKVLIISGEAENRIEKAIKAIDEFIS